MNSAAVGEFLGVFLAAGGVGYIFIFFLRLVGVYKRWPRAVFWSGAVLAALLALVAASADQSRTLLYSVAGLCAAGFIVWRGESDVRKAPERPNT